MVGMLCCSGCGRPQSGVCDVDPRLEDDAPTTLHVGRDRRRVHSRLPCNRTAKASGPNQLMATSSTTSASTMLRAATNILQNSAEQPRPCNAEMPQLRCSGGAGGGGLDVVFDAPAGSKETPEGRTYSTGAPGAAATMVLVLISNNLSHCRQRLFGSPRSFSLCLPETPRSPQDLR